MPIDFAQQYVQALASGDAERIAGWYHPDARSYGPLAWPRQGATAIAAALTKLAARLDRVETELHDVFADVAGDRVALRLMRRWSQDGIRRSAIETRYLRLALLDQFASADGTRVALRFGMRYHNMGTFFGHPPTGAHGTHGEFHSLRLVDGRIAEQVVTDVSYGIPRYELTVWHREYPQDTEDPAPRLDASRED